MKKIFRLILLSLGVTISSLCAEEEKRFIQASQVGLEVELVGLLEIPLYKEVDIEIEIIEKAARHSKELDHRIAVIYGINGRQLKKPIEIGVWKHNEEATGERIKVRAMEIALLTYYTPPNQSPFGDKDSTYQKPPSRQMLQTGLSIIATKS